MIFDSKWIDWIKNYVIIASYSFIVNNRTCGIFKQIRGLHLGDRLFMYFFTISMDILAQCLDQQTILSKYGISVKVTLRAKKTPIYYFARLQLKHANILTIHLIILSSLRSIYYFHKSTNAFSKIQQLLMSRL